MLFGPCIIYGKGNGEALKLGENYREINTAQPNFYNQNIFHMCLLSVKKNFSVTVCSPKTRKISEYAD